MNYMFQYASAFNQPLSLDTSNVTNMNNMFEVRSRAPLHSCHLNPQPLNGPAARDLRAAF